MNPSLRHRAIRERRLVPHPIPCNLVKVDGVWVESPRFVKE